MWPLCVATEIASYRASSRVLITANSGWQVSHSNHDQHDHTAIPAMEATSFDLCEQSAFTVSPLDSQLDSQLVHKLASSNGASPFAGSSPGSAANNKSVSCSELFVLNFWTFKMCKLIAIVLSKRRHLLITAASLLIVRLAVRIVRIVDLIGGFSRLAPSRPFAQFAFADFGSQRCAFSGTPAQMPTH